MLTVALTGNIASGKSTVARAWRDAGALVIESDVLSREAVVPGSPALRRIVDRWGPGILLPSGELDRAALRDVVFRDAEERRELEAIVHPEVNRLRLEAFAGAAREGVDVVAADIPLLFEVGLDREFDIIVLVDAPEEVRLRRLVDSRGLDPGEAKRMIMAQWPAERKRAAADYVIENSGSLESLRTRARKVWTEIESKARGEGSLG